MASNHIQIKNVNQGGIADSDYLGAERSVSEIVGLNIHDESGIIKLNQALSEIDDSASAIDELIMAIVSASDGNTYFFGGTNGKIWKRTSGGVWSLVRTASPAAGSAGIRGAREYQGYIYYAMQSRLGRFDLASTWSDNYATFGITDATYHPMQEVNKVLYIGDGNRVAQVDAGTFSANALDVAAPLRISALGKLGTDLLIGTYINSNVVGTEVFRWNTWSDSFSVSDDIPEVGINAFLRTDNRIVVSAGTKGNLYLYNGRQLEEYKQIKGTWGGSTNKAIVNPNAVFNFHGLPLFGLSKQTGTGVNLGVYSFGRTNANYPFILALDYPISTGNLTEVTIGAIEGNGDSFYVSWKDETGGTTYGVDELDLSNKYATGWIKTRLSLFDRIVSSTYRKIYVPYRTYPSGTDIDIHVARNHGAMTEITDTKKDAKRMLVATDVDAGEANVFQTMVELHGNNNDSPEVELVDIEVV